MAKDKILVIDSSDLLKNFLKEKLESLGFEVILSKDSFDGLIKMKNTLPDLVIMDYSLTVNQKQNFFEEKKNYNTIAGIPLILFATKVDKDALLSVARYKINKFLVKPIKIEPLLKAISELLKVEIIQDPTPCMIDVHLNDDILFIEVASGLNRDKIDSIRYKIKEIKDLYRIDTPKVLVILVDIKLTEDDHDKLIQLMLQIMRYANPHTYAVKVLTVSSEVKKILLNHERLSKIEVTNDITHAIDKLSDIRIEDLVSRGWKKTDEDILFWSNMDNSIENPQANKEEAVKVNIAVVDDDIMITEMVKAILVPSRWNVHTFNNGADFIQSVNNVNYDLLFLDLMMPKMNGLEVLQNLKNQNKLFPVIVFSALNQKETVRKVLSFGVKSYIVKPVNPEIIFKKASEVLKSNF